MIRYFIPLLIFVGLVVLFRIGLDYDPRRVPSPLIDKPVPAFSLPELKNPAVTLGSEDLKGQVTLLNVWASWCVACRHEHP
ncbi:MAG TPA: redoxin family protein, partial [Gammaproteobacteria bacterium]|nr:redoxin family protein [Gammaproteobacteria bacterium]